MIIVLRGNQNFSDTLSYIYKECLSKPPISEVSDFSDCGLCSYITRIVGANKSNLRKIYSIIEIPISCVNTKYSLMQKNEELRKLSMCGVQHLYINSLYREYLNDKVTKKLMYHRIKDPIKNFYSEYNQLGIEGETYITATYLLNNSDTFKNRDIETFYCASVLCTMCNSCLSNFKRIASQKGYDNLTAKVVGGLEKTLRFEYVEKQPIGIMPEKFKENLNQILKEFLENLSDEYIRNVKDSIKSNMLRRHATNDGKINNLTFFNNFTYSGGYPLCNIEQYSMGNMENVLDRVCCKSYLKNFVKNDIIYNNIYTVGIFTPCKNLINSKLKANYQKFATCTAENESLEKLEVKNKFDEWLEKEDDLNCLPDCYTNITLLS